ncbi:MAG: DUF2169 domain-containing protein, partial [Gammaproteobacteria bacterium]|nr:DUF2169 domain-containing protein [Gammaproteobacteria bacterium]
VTVHPRIALAAEQLPITMADEYYGDPAATSLKAVSDLHIGKPGTDVLITGHARAPRPTTEMEVLVSVGERQQTLRVLGDRVWRDDGTASTAEPFTEMPLTWERAYGGVYASPERVQAEERNPGVNIHRRLHDDVEGVDARTIGKNGHRGLERGLIDELQHGSPPRCREPGVRRGDHAALGEARRTGLDVAGPVRAHVELERVISAAQHRAFVDGRHQDRKVEGLSPQVANVGSVLLTNPRPVIGAQRRIGCRPQILVPRYEIGVEIILLDGRQRGLVVRLAHRETLAGQVDAGDRRICFPGEACERRIRHRGETVLGGFARADVAERPERAPCRAGIRQCLIYDSVLLGFPEHRHEAKERARAFRAARCELARRRPGRALPLTNTGLDGGEADGGMCVGKAALYPVSDGGLRQEGRRPHRRHLRGVRVGLIRQAELIAERRTLEALDARQRRAVLRTLLEQCPRDDAEGSIQVRDLDAAQHRLEPCPFRVTHYLCEP